MIDDFVLGCSELKDKVELRLYRKTGQETGMLSKAWVTSREVATRIIELERKRVARNAYNYMREIDFIQMIDGWIEYGENQ